MNFFNAWANVATTETTVSELEMGDFIRWEGSTHEGAVAEVCGTEEDTEYGVRILSLRASHEYGEWTSMEVSAGPEDPVTLVHPSPREVRAFRHAS